MKLPEFKLTKLKTIYSVQISDLGEFRSCLSNNLSKNVLFRVELGIYFS